MMRPVYQHSHARSVAADQSQSLINHRQSQYSSAISSAAHLKRKRGLSSSTSKTSETIYIKDIEVDSQQAIKVPSALKIKQLQVWNDCLFVLTKKTHQLLYATRLSGLKDKVSLKAHPAFEDCKI
jgi:sensor c-di-GMP phosphodiesterase-like protein